MAESKIFHKIRRFNFNDGSRSGNAANQGASFPAYRSPNGYACSLCFSQHTDFAACVRCYQQCCIRGRLNNGTQQVMSSQGEPHRCVLCSKTWVNRLDAETCFAQCKNAMQKRTLPDELFKTLQLLDEKQNNDKLLRPGPRPLVRGVKGGGRLPDVHYNKSPVAIATDTAETLETFDTVTVVTGVSAVNSEKPSEAQVLMSDDPLVAQLAKVTSAGTGTLDLDTWGFETETPIIQGNLDMGATSGLLEELTDIEAHPTTAPTLEPAQQTPELSSSDSLPPKQNIIAQQDHAPTPELQAAPAKKEPIRDKNGTILTRKPGQKPFTRADAKYVCGVCNAKYFTKSEVEACFQDHPVEE